MNELKAMRESVGMSRRQVSDISGVPEEHIRNYESGRVAVTAKYLDAIKIIAATCPPKRGKARRDRAVTTPATFKLRREAVGLTRAQVAKILDVSESTVKHVENGVRVPDQPYVEAFERLVTGLVK